MKKFTFIIITVFLLCSCQKQQSNTANTLHLTHNQNMARKNASLVFNYLSKGYTDRAQENLQLALAEAPDDPVVLETAGFYYEKTGDLRTANKFFKKAVTDYPTSGIVKNNYGSFLCRNSKYKASIPYFIAASRIKDTPITQEALRNAQYCYKKMQTRLGVSTT